MIKGRTLLAALAAALLLATGDAQASFRYSVTASPATTSFGLSNFGVPGITTLTPTAGPFLSGTTDVNLSQVTQTSTRNPNTGTDTANIPLTLSVFIQNQENGLSGTFTVTGTVSITRSDSQGSLSTYTLNTISPAVLNLGLFNYTLSNLTYSAPTIRSTGNTDGSIGARITEAFIPEPASLVMMGTGVLALGGLGVARRRNRT